ncbi:MAG: T9SS type A sorting domain-containing protein [Flavobacteriales bacterium]|nr:T9SS type A sorting domain-containing protein [Flavobacteriales bacterium]
MKTRFTFLSVLLALLVSSTGVFAQCENTSMYPASAVTVDGQNVTTISGCNYAGEYGQITGVSAGRSYEFAADNASTYVTVREGSSGGTVLISGVTPVTAVSGTGADLYVHWNTDASCGTASSCLTTTVLDVTPPCDNSGADGQYPSSAISIGSVGVQTTIATDQYAGSEYSVITGMTSGNYYEVTHANGAYITVRDGAVDGAVVASGYSPLYFTAASASNVYIHWTVDDLCATLGLGGGTYTTTITDLGLPPCQNSSQYPISAVTPDAGGAVTTISTNQYYGSEYSVITGVLNGHEYEFTHSNGAYITVRVGAVDGALLGNGYSPLSVQTTGTDDLYVHWTVDDACATDASGSYTTTVQDMGIPPCNNTTASGQYPVGSITPDAGGAVTTISTAQYLGSEYSVITGIQSGYDYIFTHSNATTFITVRAGAVDGTVLGSGVSPLTVTATSTDNLYVHWNADEFCAVDASGSYTTTVQAVAPCTADAGTTTADASTVCLSGGSATISATADGNQVIPSGYQAIGVLADASGNILDGGTLSYTVYAAGDYYIHIGVVNPADLTTYQTASTVAGLYALTIDGGGSLCGSIDQTGTMITVDEPAIASFTSSQVMGTLQVDFTNASTGTAPLTYAWDFGDSNGTSTDTDPSYTYGADGSFDVMLTATNSCGSDDTTITVSVLPVPTPCTSSANTWVDLNTAGGAPCFDGSQCIVTDPGYSGIGVFGSETYLLSNVQAGYDYVFDMCSGFGAGAWIPEITIVAADGTTIDAWNGGYATGSSLTFNDQCSLEWTASQSGTYYIVINELGTAAGDAPSQTDCGTSLQVDNGNPTVTCGTNPYTCPPPPANDECSGAIALTVNQTCVATAGDVTSATESMTGCAGTANEDVWYSFQATGPEATVEVTGATGFDAVLEIFSGSCGSLTSMQCVDNTGDAGTESYDLTGLTTGMTYYVRTYEYYSGTPAATGFDICVHAMTIGIENALENGLSVYPNPSNGQFIVEVSGIEADAQIIVNDLAGRQVYSEGVVMNKAFRKEMNLDVASGTYLLQIVTVDGTVTRKIQVN